MNPDYREVLYLTYFEDMSYAQAAEPIFKNILIIARLCQSSSVSGASGSTASAVNLPSAS